MRRLAISVAAAIAIGATPAISQKAHAVPTYICVPEKSVGFLFKNGQWDIAHFRPDYKFVVRKSSDSSHKDITWRLFMFGHSFGR